MNRFHLAFSVFDLNKTRDFYVGALGCKEGRSAETWVDFDFYGHQISCHENPQTDPIDFSNTVEDKAVPIPHFGMVLSYEQFDELVGRIQSSGVEFLYEPFVRFEGKSGEQKSCFIRDPSGNCLEFKAFRDIEKLFV